MRIEPLEHLPRGLFELAAAPSPGNPAGDDTATAILVLVMLLGIVLLVQLAVAKGRRMPPGTKTPWTGWYEAPVAPESKVSKKGNPLPPTTTAGSEWKLKESYSLSFRHLVAIVLLAALGLLCFGQNISGIQVGTPSPPAPGPVTTTVPQPGALPPRPRPTNSHKPPRPGGRRTLPPRP